MKDPFNYSDEEWIAYKHRLLVWTIVFWCIGLALGLFLMIGGGMPWWGVLIAIYVVGTIPMYVDDVWGEKDFAGAGFLGTIIGVILQFALWQIMFIPRFIALFA